MIGDNMIIPIDINMLATTRSMIINGMNSKKPMLNAVFNSLKIKAGAITVNGMSLYVRYLIFFRSFF